ncbi:MAG: single-stranded-DNA-specific exonuclease RecJ [Desulfuromonadales bacterium]
MEPVSGRQWMLRHPAVDYSAANDYAQQLGVPNLVARLLIGRQFSIDSARRFLAVRLADLPDPFLLPDMDLAVKRLHAAIEHGEKIAVHGDYDVDGIAGTVLLTTVLEALGAAVEYHIPLRLRDGYGLSGEAIKAAADRGIAVIVSVDCGVSSHQEAEIARQHGVDLIVTDHHQPPSTLPQAVAVINPQRKDSGFPFQPLAGVGVAFFLLIALRKALRESGWFKQRPEPDLRDYLDLVALGTIADLVPLRGVNRIMARHGLRLIENRPRIGLRALKQVASVKNVSSGVVAFQLAPRLNAAGRIEDAALGVELLLEEDMVQALHTARYLDQCNRRRQELEQQTLKEAEAAIAGLSEQYTHTIVLGGEGWHPGVIGIVASRLVERYHRPTVLVALDGEGGKGSARSIRGYHLYRALQACADHLTAFGGHEMAAGLGLDRKSLPGFATHLEAHARAELGADDLLPRINHDGTVLLEEINLDTLHQMTDMAPFGMDNPEPLMVVESARAMRVQEVKGGHLRFTVCQGAFSHPAIAFGMLGRRQELQGEIDLLVAPQINYYQGRETVQLRVKDVRPAAADVS